LKRFKSYCLENELDYSQGLEDVLTIFFDLLDKGEILSAKTRAITIADLIRDWNLEELATLSEVPVENLHAILQGNTPTNDDLIGLGVVLCKDNGEPWTTDELVEIRDRISGSDSVQAGCGSAKLPLQRNADCFFSHLPNLPKNGIR